MAVAEDTFEFVDRYGEAGPPSLRVGCRGPCEATGFVPVYMAEGDRRPPAETAWIRAQPESEPVLVERWRAAEAQAPSLDGWHFVICPECGGTGRTRGLARLACQLGWFVCGKAAFAARHVFVRPYTGELARRALAWERRHPECAVEGGPANPHRYPYGDRLDVPRPWLSNRLVALRVLFGRR